MRSPTSHARPETTPILLSGFDYSDYRNLAPSQISSHGWCRSRTSITGVVQMQLGQ